MLFDSLYVMMGISLCNFSLKATLHVLTKCDDLKPKKIRKEKEINQQRRKKKSYYKVSRNLYNLLK